MFADQRRALRFIRDPSQRGLWAAWFLERTADWLVFLALLAAAAQGSVENASAVAWTIALWVAPRFVLGVLYADAGSRLGRLGWPWLTLAKAALTAALVGGAVAGMIRSLEVLLGLTAVFGFTSALSADARHGILRRGFGRQQLGQASVTASVLDRAALLTGALVAMISALLLPEGSVSPIPAVGLFIAAAGLAYMAARSTASSGRKSPATESSSDISQDLARRIVIWLAAAFTGGAVASALLVGAFAMFSVQCLNYGPCDVVTLATAGPILVGAAGLGMLMGQLPLPRLLVRLSAEVLLAILAFIVVIAIVAITALRASGPLYLPMLQLAAVAAAFLVFGFAAGNIDRLRSIALHRLAPPDQLARLKRISFLALTAGQLFGAIGIVSATGRDPIAVAALLAIAQVLLLILGLARAGRGALEVGSLSLLPVRSVVHKLSWDTRPEAEPADFSKAPERVNRLSRWINRQAKVEKLHVTLPRSGREYEIYRPTEEAREQLFDQGRADPDKQMPYWAKVWPSGVALADEVVERKEEVAGKHVLELGAGLGVTACVVLEYGGQLVTADYSALPLAYCRLNTLANTGRAPDATCFNWRHDAEVTAALSQPEFRDGFPLIIAGDVLYEGRDAEPLLNVIERMLVADGSLWLAEPVRRTAQRFLDSAASLGWQIESRQVQAAWPDATDGPVNLHFLRRSEQPDTLTADLGGWRI